MVHQISDLLILVCLVKVKWEARSVKRIDAEDPGLDGIRTACGCMDSEVAALGMPSDIELYLRRDLTRDISDVARGLLLRGDRILIGKLEVFFPADQGSWKHIAANWICSFSLVLAQRCDTLTSL